MSKSNINAPPWFDGWKTKYETILVEGLTDGPTYVRLAHKECPTLDVDLAFRPMVSRISEEMLVLGGKLSVFPRKNTVKAEPSSPTVMVGWLTAAYPNFAFPKKDPTRVGTVVLSTVKAPMFAKKVFIDNFNDSPFVDQLLDYIEQAGDVKIQDRKLASRAIREAYVGWLDYAFLPGEDLKAKVELSGEFADGDNIVPFLKKQTDQIGKGNPTLN